MYGLTFRLFTKNDNVSFEMPIAQASGRRFLTKTLEESYHMYKEDCNKSDKKGMAFSTFCHLRPKNIYKIRHLINSAFVINVKIFIC